VQQTSHYDLSFGCTVAILHSDTAIVYYISIYTTGNTYRSVSVTHLLLEGSSRLAQRAATPAETTREPENRLCFELFCFVFCRTPHSTASPTLVLYCTLLSLVTGRWACFSNLITLTVRSSPSALPSCLYCTVSCQCLCTDRPTDRPRIMIAHSLSELILSSASRRLLVVARQPHSFSLPSSY